MIIQTEDLSQQIEGDFIAMLDEFHSLNEVWDNDLDKQIAKWYSNPPNVYPKRPYFSPSSATKCPRELYYKAKRAKKDVVTKQPHQSRWQNIGTVIGDMIQRELLSIERNLEKRTGNKPKFVFERTDKGEPMMEEFAKANVPVEHNGEKFYLFGSPDGVMKYTLDSGEVIRVGLEIKSKQQNPAKTSKGSMKEAQEAHVAQTNLYAYMYGVDYYVILYQNASKRAWDMSEEDYEKFPDIRAFCRKITDADRKEIFDKFAKITKAIRSDEAPRIDLAEWKFNDYKQAIAEGFTEEEVEAVRRQADQAKASSLPNWVANNYTKAYEDIEKMRSGYNA